MSVQTVNQSALPSKYADLIHNDIQKDQSMRTGMQALTFNQGFMFIGDTNIGQGPFHCYILAACRINAWYDKPYNPQVQAIPACYSFFEDDNHEALAVPHAQSEQPQCGSCAQCPKNAWGSTTVPGRKGKACQNAWRAIVLPAGTYDSSGQYQLFNAEGLAAQTMMPVRFPVTSSKNFNNYIKTCALRDGRPKYFYVTGISSAPHPQNQFEVKFNQVHLPTDEAVLDMLFNLKNSAEAQIVQPFQKPEQQAPAPIVQQQVAPQVQQFTNPPPGHQPQGQPQRY